MDETPGYARQHAAATGTRDAHGFGATAKGSGMLALTDRRLLFFNMRTVLGRPKKLAAAISIDQFAGAAYEKPMLTVEFVDGSAVGLHVPQTQHPDAFVAAIRRS